MGIHDASKICIINTDGYHKSIVLPRTNTDVFVYSVKPLRTYPPKMRICIYVIVCVVIDCGTNRGLYGSRARNVVKILAC